MSAGAGSRVAGAALDFTRSELLTGVSALAAGAVLWQALAVALRADWLPTFLQVLDKTVDLLGDAAFRTALWDSLGAAALGYAIAVVLGVTAGVTMGLSPLVNSALRVYLDLLLFVPPIVTAPIFLVVFGLSKTTLLAIIVVFAATVIAVNSRVAVASTDPHLQDVARVFGASRSQYVGRVVLRGALPLIFVGLHLGVARALKGLIIGQLFLAVVGLGAYEARFEQSFDAAGIWSIALIVVGVALVLSWFVKFVDSVVNYWA
jgi:NitT/TauT family transport system permease protein